MPKRQLTGKQSDFLKIVVAAAGRGDLTTVRQLVEENPAWVCTVGSHGRTMLWEAVYRGKRNVVEFLIERGADVNAYGCHHSQHFVEISPYCVAKSRGRGDLADYLLANGAEMDIHSAAYLGDYDRVVSLLGKEPTLVNRGHTQTEMSKAGEGLAFEYKEAAWATPLLYAISGGRVDVVALLISRGAEVSAYSETLLKCAVWRKRTDIVEMLLESGADPHKAPRVYSDDGELFQLLHSYGVEPADVNSANRMGWPPLVYASRGDKGEHPERVQRLLDLGADVNGRNRKGQTALHCAAKAGFLRVMEVLIGHGADVNAADCKGETPLFEAVRSTIKDAAKRKESVALLLSKGAGPHVQNHKGESPLKIAQRATRKEASEIADLLSHFRE